VVTATRAEYGMLAPLLHAIAADPVLELQLVVTGAHLSNQFGETWRQIEADGFTIAARVAMLLSSDTGVAAAKAIGLGALGLADAFDNLKPDLAIVLGDRYELLAVASTTLMLRIPLLHLHGGECTEGAVDESIRHAITKLASLHAVAADEFARRVLQLGEPADRVYVVGTLSLDAMAATPLLTRGALCEDLGLAPEGSFLVLTWHPETNSCDYGLSGLAAILAALDRRPEFQVVITAPNADPGSSAVRAAIGAWASRNPERARSVENLGTRRYWSAVAEASAVIGNSSSGLIEAPQLATPTVNVGSRQDGRPRAPSVIDCEARADAVDAALTRALSEAHLTRTRERRSPYGGPGAAERIVAIVRTASLDALRVKPFRDYPIGDASSAAAEGGKP